MFNKIKPPYNINQSSQELALQSLKNIEKVNNWIHETVNEREQLIKDLLAFSFVKKVYPSDANFILVKTLDAQAIYAHLSNQEIIVRDRSKVTLCEGCLRITIGTPAENLLLIDTLKKYS